MPNATASNEAVKRELKSLPGGFVTLRRLTYGEQLHRRDISATFVPGTKAEDGRIETSALRVQHYEFTKAVMEHNLTDENDKPLNFNDMQDVVKLDPRVGGEIEQMIDEMNQPPDEGAQKSMGDGSAQSDTA